MPPVFVDCPVHGPSPAPGLIGGSGGARVTVENSYGRCPVCGITSPILSGEYTFYASHTEAVLRLRHPTALNDTQQHSTHSP